MQAYIGQKKRMLRLTNIIGPDIFCQYCWWCVFVLQRIHITNPEKDRPRWDLSVGFLANSVLGCWTALVVPMPNSGAVLSHGLSLIVTAWPVNLISLENLQRKINFSNFFILIVYLNIFKTHFLKWPLKSLSRKKVIYWQLYFWKYISMICSKKHIIAILRQLQK